MMTRQEAEAIYDAGRETVVRVLLMMDARIQALEERVQSLENQLAKTSRNSSKPPFLKGSTLLCSTARGSRPQQSI